MHTELAIPLSTLFGFLLVLTRVAGVIVMVPIPGLSAGPDATRAALAVALTGVLFPVWSAPPVQNIAPPELILWMAGEAAFGLTIGVAVAFLLEGLQMAAQIIGLQAGYSYASTIDPSTQADTTTLQIMAQLLAGMLFFALGLDRQLIQILARSFQSIPPGAYALRGPSAEVLTRLGAGIFWTGLRLALPVLALLILLDVAFAVLGRVQAQLQLLSLAFAVKMLAGLAFLASVLSLYPAAFRQAAESTFGALGQLLNR